jgi:voltage-gated potassium channel
MTEARADWTAHLLAEGALAPPHAHAYRLGIIAAALAMTVITMVDTVTGAWGGYALIAELIEDLALAALGFDYLIRVADGYVVGEHQGSAVAGVWRYVTGVYGIFDILAVAPVFIGNLFDVGADGNAVFGLLAFIKLARYSPALETLGAVVLDEIQPLASALFILILLAPTTSTALYFVERHVNPHGFASIPEAMWWSIVTLTTLGYGDTVPMTPLGKVLGAATALIGLCMFALPASILATGFSEEMRRRSFLNTWALVAKVPFFTQLPAQQIAEIASMLKLYRAGRDEVLVRRGDIGDSMYFIIAGAVEVAAPKGNFVLRDGDFFGEIAMLHHGPRTADVRSLTRSQLLILDARDFNRFVASYPDLKEVIMQTAKQRMEGK